MVIVRPLTNVHAHNDYEHTRPLLDALDNGFCSVEADIHLVNRKLLVAHSAKDVKPERTLESLYLDPLRERAKKNGGHIYKTPAAVVLLIDIKTAADPTYAVLRTVLARYSDILTSSTPTKTTQRAVTVVLSGNRPTIATLSAEPVRYAGYDGRPSDLDQGISPKVMPLVSEGWAAFSSWSGTAGTTITDAERKKVTAFIVKAHQQGYRVRFWATPDTRATWQAMRDFKVDLINTDDLPGLRAFFTQNKADK